MWSSNVKANTNDPNVGTVIAYWTGIASGTANVIENYNYLQDQVTRTTSGLNFFVSGAKAGLVIYQSNLALELANELIVTNKLNAP